MVEGLRWKCYELCERELHFNAQRIVFLFSSKLFDVSSRSLAFDTKRFYILRSLHNYGGGVVWMRDRALSPSGFAPLWLDRA